MVALQSTTESYPSTIVFKFASPTNTLPALSERIAGRMTVCRLVHLWKQPMPRPMALGKNKNSTADASRKTKVVRLVLGRRTVFKLLHAWKAYGPTVVTSGNITDSTALDIKPLS
jgi:hypothetical protein